ncbi:MAG: FAD-binding oxidoreductase [Rhodobacteraceae bacterium]|nr:FAD-binding oxidoreductase [Paracoccaceae bacterium]
MTPPALRDADGPLLERLTEALGPGGVTAPDPRYLSEPRGRWHGRAAAVLKPDTVAAVAAAVRLCAEARVGIVPYAGGTGLVGGQILEAGPVPVVLSVERLNRIRAVEVTDNVITAEAGAILADVHAAAEAAGRFFPLSLASEGSARIGGLLGTNAGGLNVLRYGNARDLCLGVEAVMADGSVHHGLSCLMKDNMGYDLRHLLIGSEGTLGLITAASLRLHPAPAETATAWMLVASPEAALALLALARERLGAALNAFELMHVEGMRFLAETMPQVRLPAPMGTDWAVLAEVSDGAGSEVAARFTGLLADALEAGIAEDGLLAQSEAQRQSFWRVRESIPEANRHVGSISSHDVSVPPSRIAEFIARGPAAIAALDPSLRINCFGHLGDGNLHYNVFPPRGRHRDEFDSLRGAVKAAIHDLVHELGGSVGAEHGVGRLKVEDLERYGDPAKLAAMRRIKAALDPLGILNPGAVISGG